MGKTKPQNGKQPYEAPELRVLGSLHELTLQLAPGHHCDPACFHHGSLAPEH